MVWCGARNSRVVMQAVWRPVKPATRWMQVVSMAAVRIMSGRWVASPQAVICG
jgi:hypothetical protein